MDHRRVIDGVLIVASFVVVVAVGFAFSRRAENSLRDSFVADRGAP
jgi:hypothetical protein